VSRDAGSVHFGIVRVDLHVPGADGLKAKRAVLQRARAALKDELGCSVAEVGYQDTWQRAALGIAVAASTHTGVERVLDRVVGVLERDPRLVVLGTAEDVDSMDADGPDIRPPHP
jgi:uncharacterized protein